MPSTGEFTCQLPSLVTRTYDGVYVEKWKKPKGLNLSLQGLGLSLVELKAILIFLRQQVQRTGGPTLSLERRNHGYANLLYILSFKQKGNNTGLSCEYDSWVNSTNKINIFFLCPNVTDWSKPYDATDT